MAYCSVKKLIGIKGLRAGGSKWTAAFAFKRSCTRSADILPMFHVVWFRVVTDCGSPGHETLDFAHPQARSILHGACMLPQPCDVSWSQPGQ